MGTKQKTVIVTGASQGIGAGVVQAFLNRGYNVVATHGTSRSPGHLRSPASLRWWTAISAKALWPQR